MELRLLRSQSPDFDTLSFLSGPSEMARRIREFDWTDHPLGAPADWPSSLRLALGIALNSSFPTCIYWGSELRLLYNDAWSTIPGPRHPACLGEPAAEVWSDIWHIIQPQFEQVIRSGTGLFLENQFLPMRRYGVEEETYWTYNFTAMRLENGSIGGVFNSGSETTESVLQQTNTQFLLELSDVFRNLRDAESVRSRPLQMLGMHLGADRVGLREDKVWNGTEVSDLPVTELWVAPGVADGSGKLRDTSLPPEIWKALLDGHVVRLDGSDPKRGDLEPSVLTLLGCASALAVPWARAGKTAAILFVHSLKPRHWTDLDVQTVEAVLDRMMSWLEKARTAERERAMSHEIDHRARNLLAIVQSIVRMAKPDDPMEMQKKILGRIMALSKTHSLLANRHWDQLTVREILVQELGPFTDQEDTETRVAGPSVTLTADESQVLSMAFHELTTNAAKYGALSCPGGVLDVHWDLTPEGLLRLEWVETFGQRKDSGPTAQSGFGTRLLTLVVERQLGGKLSKELDAQRLRALIEVPLQASVAVEA